MILTCAIKRDYLGIPYLVVSRRDTLNRDVILVNSEGLGPSPDFSYAFCLRAVTKTNFALQATELKAVEACLDSRVALAAEELPYDVKASFENLESFTIDSARVFTLRSFILKLLPSGPTTRALFAPAGRFSEWSDWISRCFAPITFKRENAGDYAFYATLIPSRYISRIVNLISRDENEKMEAVLETLLKGGYTTNTGITMSRPVADRLLESFKLITSESSFELQRVTFYLRSLCCLVFPFEGVDWFSSFQPSDVSPVEKDVHADVVLASAKGVTLTGGEFTKYQGDIVSFDINQAPSISIDVQGSLVAFDKNLISRTGHVVWGSSWREDVRYPNPKEGLEGEFFYDGSVVTRLGPGMTGFEVNKHQWISNPLGA